MHVGWENYSLLIVGALAALVQPVLFYLGFVLLSRKKKTQPPKPAEKSQKSELEPVLSPANRAVIFGSLVLSFFLILFPLVAAFRDSIRQSGDSAVFALITLFMVLAYLALSVLYLNHKKDLKWGDRGK